MREEADGRTLQSKLNDLTEENFADYFKKVDELATLIEQAKTHASRVGHKSVYDDMRQLLSVVMPLTKIMYTKYDKASTVMVRAEKVSKDACFEMMEYVSEKTRSEQFDQSLFNSDSLASTWDISTVSQIKHMFSQSREINKPLSPEHIKPKLIYKHVKR
jgi:hypothetical protein